jgi:hypothetical protein
MDPECTLPMNTLNKKTPVDLSEGPLVNNV